MFKRMLSVVMLTAITLPALAEGSAQAGEQKAARCQGCHGAQGISTVPGYPNLAGQNADYLASALQAYKTGGRSGGEAEMMKAFVAGFSEQDIKDIAAWYAGLRP
ncbi:cytochrome c [Erwinia sp. P6884]|uniref:c-type cytochrome n=1 Tax=Erwinia sp. P6884 TaxID=3141450 RepID=UPI00319B9EC7